MLDQIELNSRTHFRIFSTRDFEHILFFFFSKQSRSRKYGGAGFCICRVEVQQIFKKRSVAFLMKKKGKTKMINVLSRMLPCTNLSYLVCCGHACWAHSCACFAQLWQQLGRHSQRLKRETRCSDEIFGTRNHDCIAF